MTEGHKQYKWTPSGNQKTQRSSKLWNEKILQAMTGARGCTRLATLVLWYARNVNSRICC